MKTLILLALLTASYMPESAPEPGVLGEESVKERLQWYLGRYN